MELKEIGENICEARLRRKLSLRKFAKLAGSGHSTLLRLERGEDVKVSVFLKASAEAGFQNMVKGEPFV